MGFGHSKNSEFYWGTTDLTPYLTNVSLPRDGGVADTTVLNDDSKTYVRGQSDATVSLDGKLDDSVLIGTVLDVDGTAATAFKYFPHGSVTSRPVYEGSGFVTAFSGDSPLDGAVEWSASIQATGGITDGTVA